MVHLLLKWFVPNYEQTESDAVRERYGFLSGMVGIICNIILFVLKYIMGVLSGSVSIISDAFNNLSDSGSCILTLVGYKMAAKPADKDHPFGHGRMEYLFSLIIAVIIVLVGVELFQSSFDKIFHPKAVTFSWFVLAALLLSVGVKLWMAYFNNRLGKMINSSIMQATAKDSLSDVIATTTTIIALVASKFTQLPLDGIMGCVVSLFIFFAGYSIIRDTVDDLIGKPANPETVAKIKEILASDENVLGLHDMVIHSYGPGVVFGSVHVEVDCRNNIMEIHDAVDLLEKEVYETLGVILTVHMDPVETDNEFVNSRKQMVKEILLKLDSELTFHDFRVVAGPTHTNLIFDIVQPFDCKLKEQDIKNYLKDELDKEEIQYYAVVNIEREYV